MISVTYVAAYAAALVSIVGNTRIAIKHHNRENPVSLSELAAAQEALLNRFRVILWLGGTLFAVTVYLFIIPRANHRIAIMLAWSAGYIGDLMAAIIPARDKTFKFHNLAAQLMGVGLLALAYVFWVELQGAGRVIETSIALVMTALAIGTFADKRRFVFYELAFIYLSHASIITAATALYLAGQV